jgi:4-amino-4-deoxy-L-arabinose transferase-like glycosyltransferase
MGFVDMGAMFFGAAALLPLQKFLEEFRLRDAAMAGLFVGMSTCCKITSGLLLVLPFCLALIFVGATYMSRKSLAVWKGAILMGLVALLAYSPYMVRNWIGSGSPFAPALSQYFPLRPEFEEALTHFEWIHSLRFQTFFQKPKSTLQFYLEQIAYDGSSAALILPLTVPFALAWGLWKRNRTAVFLSLSAGLALILYALAGPTKSSRFAVPLIPLFSVLAANLTWVLVKRMRDRWAIAFAAAFALAATAVVLLGVHAYRGEYLHRPLLSKTSRLAFLQTVDAAWPQLQYLNDNLSKDDRVAFHKAAIRWRFLEIPFSTASYWGPSHAEYFWLKAQQTNPGNPNEEFRRLLEKVGINHILVGKEHLIFPMEIFEIVYEWPDAQLMALRPNRSTA